MLRMLRLVLWTFAALWTPLALAIVSQSATDAPVGAATPPAVAAVLLALPLTLRGGRDRSLPLGRAPRGRVRSARAY